jgi:hypothetical protein
MFVPLPGVVSDSNKLDYKTTKRALNIFYLRLPLSKTLSLSATGPLSLTFIFALCLSLNLPVDPVSK